MTRNIEQIVSDSFDELFTEILSKEKFHPSEEYNRLRSMSKFGNWKKFAFINAYHGFCRICNQHFYTRSVVDDINSFFQKHINTSYHRQTRMVDLPPDDHPMFTWEKEFHTGRCHVCNMSGLNSYVLDTKYVIAWLMEVHICVWGKNMLESNDEFLWKLSSLKKYCGLKIFREKIIKTINGKSFCLMCQTTVPWSGEKAACHLTSDTHYSNFCAFVQKYLSFLPNDILNGFNLEIIIRYVASLQLKVSSFADVDERNLCLELSNDEKNPYPDGDVCSFSPKHVEELLDGEDSDFIFNKECLLCNVAATPWHMRSSLHRSKAENVNETSFSDPVRYAMFWKNRLKRQRMKRTYVMLQDGLRKSEKTETSRMENSKACYLKTLFEKKLESVDFTFTMSDLGEMFCEVCDRYLTTDPDLHLNSIEHQSQMGVWTTVREKYKDQRSMEPFKQIRKVIVCLLCGVVLNSNTFCSHLKSFCHMDNFENYVGLNVPPVSSAFEMNDDFSCKCITCGLKLNGKIDLSKLKEALKAVLQHWPCPNASKKPETDYGMDFKKVEKTIEGIVSVFEKKILERVTEKTVRHVRASGLTDMGNRLKRSPTCGCGLPSTCSCTRRAAEEEKVYKGDMNDEKTDREEEENEVLNSEKKKENLGKEEEEEEVLVIGGLPKSKRTHDTIYSNFRVFGKIRSVVFRDSKAIVKFAEKGVVELVTAKGPALFFEDKLTFSVSTRKEAWETERKLLPLNKHLVTILESELKLTEFVRGLIQEADNAFNSPSERKREEAICHSIIHAVYRHFPKGRCYPFGSRLSGLTLNVSDLDVFLDCDGMYEGSKHTSSFAEKALVNKVAKLLRKEHEIKVTKVVDRARVPIVSFYHLPTRMNCDLSFKNGLSIQNTLLIKIILSLDSRVKPLILFLKYWAKVNALHGPSFFSSYAIAMLVVFYLEQLVPPVLPTVESLQYNHVGPRTTIAGWDCSVNVKPSDLKKSTNEEKFQSLLAGFFEFYAGFDYKQNVISPLTGTPLPRQAFSESGFFSLPLCYRRQILNLRQPIENLVSEKYFLCVIDPFDLSHNLTKSFTRRGFQAFTHYCLLSGEKLKKALMP